MLKKLAKTLEDAGEHEEAMEVLKLLKEEPKAEVKEEKEARVDEMVQHEKDIDGKELHTITIRVSGETEEELLKAIYKTLAELADKLDENGAVKEANVVDGLLKKFAAEWKWEKRDDSKYDAKANNEKTHLPPTKPQKAPRKHHKEEYEQTGEKMLSQRHCVDHIGVMLHRVGENSYRCPLDGKVYNWEEGFTDVNGNKHPGGSVSEQTEVASNVPTPHRLFDPREETLNRIN